MSTHGAQNADRAEAPRLVFFYSPRSGQSRRAESFLAQVLQRRRNHDTFRLLRVDVDDRPDLAARFGIDATPTLLVIDRSRIRARLSEPKGNREIAAMLSPWLR